MSRRNFFTNILPFPPQQQVQRWHFPEVGVGKEERVAVSLFHPWQQHVAFLYSACELEGEDTERRCSSSSSSSIYSKRTSNTAAAARPRWLEGREGVCVHLLPASIPGKRSRSKRKEKKKDKQCCSIKYLLYIEWLRYQNSTVPTGFFLTLWDTTPPHPPNERQGCTVMIGQGISCVMTTFQCKCAAEFPHGQGSRGEVHIWLKNSLK